MILLDTHAWVWLVSEPERLSVEARTLIEEHVAQGQVLVSSISVWEVAMLVDKGRLKLRLDVSTWLGKCEALTFLTFVPLDNEIALRSVALPNWPHPDPADRIIAATALKLGIPLVTQDKALRRYDVLATVW